jgi:hypothetical protein
MMEGRIGIGISAVGVGFGVSVSVGASVVVVLLVVMTSLGGWGETEVDAVDVVATDFLVLQPPTTSIATIRKVETRPTFESNSPRS